MAAAAGDGKRICVYLFSPTLRLPRRHRF